MPKAKRDTVGSRHAAPRSRSRLREHGAAAVEMALILPLLLIMVGGIVDMGRYMFTKEIVINAAREGARSMAVGYNQTQSRTTVTSAIAGGVTVGSPTIVLNGASSTGSDTLPACPTASPVVGDTVTVTVTTTGFRYIILGAAASIIRGGGGPLVAPQPSGTALMRCGG